MSDPLPPPSPEPFGNPPDVETGGFARADAGDDGSGGTAGEPQESSFRLQFNQVNAAFFGAGGKRAEAERPSLFTIHEKDLARAHELFVPSADFRAKLADGARRPDLNVWLVHGEVHAGKLTTAVCLALALQGKEPSEAKVACYRRSPGDTLTLLDFARAEETESGHAYLIEDAFERGVDTRELESPWIEALDRLLRDKGCHLVLTTRRKPEELEPLSIGRIAALPEDLAEVFEKHLARFGKHVEAVDIDDEVRQRARDAWPKLQPFLARPVQIERFCYKLGDLRPPEAVPKRLVELAQEAAFIGRESVRTAFRELSENERLYALLAVLFPGLDRPLLERIYTLAVESLRSAGIETLRDPRETGLDDVLERIRARESETREVGFEDAAFEEEVRRQVRNHRHLLWSISEMLIGLCRLLRGPRHWELRRSVGAALGRLGVYERHDLEPLSEVLQKLALDPDGAVVAVAGALLDQVCRDAPELQGKVVELLEGWVKSGDPDLMWAAGAAVWRVYGTIAGPAERERQAGAGDRAEPGLSPFEERLFQVLADLVRNRDRFADARKAAASLEETEQWAGDNLRSAFHALTWLAVRHPGGATGKLCEWLRAEPADPLHSVAQLLARKLFEDEARARLEPLAERQGEWLQAVEPILSLDPDLAGTADALMALLASWLRWPGWPERVFARLLKAANRLHGRPARVLRAGLLRHWLTADPPEARDLGRALVTRSLAMEGFPVATAGQGVIALDASSEAFACPRLQELGLQLHEVLQCYADPCLVHLGGRRISSPAGSSRLALADLRPSHARPRLLLAPAERLAAAGAGPTWAVALLLGPVLDWEDVLEEPWARSLVPVLAAPQIAPPDEASPIPPVPCDFEAVLAALAAALDAAGAGLPETGEPEEWLGALDRPDSATGRGDLARKTVAILLHESRRGLPGCLERADRWLAGARPEDAAWHLGAAVVRALLRSTTGRDPLPAAEDLAALVRLAFRLDEADWSAAEVLLQAVFSWLADSGWARSVAAGEPLGEELASWSERLIPLHRRRLKALLRSWRERAERGEAPAAAAGLAGRLELRVALGAGEPLPAAPGQTYGLLLLDAASRGRALRERLASLVGELLELAREGGHLADVRLLVFRMGRRLPVAVPGEKLEAGVLFPPEMGSLPRLVGPVLAALHPEQVRFALLLTAAPVLDAEDWSDGAWAGKIHLYGPGGAATAGPFERIPAAIGLPEAEAIARHLLQSTA